MRGSRLELAHAIDLSVHAFQRGGEHLLALQGVLVCARKACASLRPFSAHCTTFFARQGALPIAHLAQTLAQRLEIIKRSVIDFRMVSAQDDLMLVVAENAALEFAGYGHGGPPRVRSTAQNRSSIQYYVQNSISKGYWEPTVLGKDRSTNMSTAANANAASEVAPWHAMSVDEVVKRLTTDTGKGLHAGEASSRLQKYGPNRLPEGKKRGPFMRFLSQFNNILVYVLLGAGFTKLMLNLWTDAARTAAAIPVNEAAQAADDAPDFSERIRASLPTMPHPMRRTQTQN